MSGHSKWATIKRKKGAEDAKRGKIFTKIIRELTVAARAGGGDPDNNPRLRTVIEKAKEANMPSDNVTRAIKKGTGDLEGANYEEFNLEGYGPGGVAVLLDVMTDNRNRSVSEVRHIFSRNGGNMGEAGCVGWNFHKKGVIVFSKVGLNEDQLMETALEAGAEDMKDADEVFEVLTEPASYEAVKKVLEGKGFKPVSSQITMIPENTMKIAGGEAEKMLKLIDALEDNDDVQNVYSNFDIDKEELEKLNA